MLKALFALCVTASAALAETPVKLVYRPVEVQYKTQSSEVIRMDKADGTLESLAFNVLQQSRETRAARPDGTLEVKQVTLSTRVRANGEYAPPGLVEAPPRTYAIRPNGAPVEPKPVTAESAFELVFPAGPIAPKQSWTVVAPASDQTPVDLTVTHTCDRIETVGGVRCAIIISKAEGKGRKRDGTPLGIRIETHSAFAIDAGVLVRSISERKLLMKRPKPAPGEDATYSSRLVRLIERQAAGSPAPTDAPAGTH